MIGYKRVADRVLHRCCLIRETLETEFASYVQDVSQPILHILEADSGGNFE